MKTERIDFSGLSGYLWTPDAEPRALILVIHGMTEHSGRYGSFAKAMTLAGMAVAAYDLRGHGRNAAGSDCAAMAPGDWSRSVDDIGHAIERLREWYCGPLYLLGFSLGSFLVREYMEREDAKMDGVILMGTGTQPRWLLKVMKLLVSSQVKKAGFTQTTELVRQLSFGAYNQKFKPNRTNSDWLCSDETELDRYLADPLCKPDIAAGTFYELLGSMERTAASASHSSNRFMPVLLLSGDRDPVGNFGKGAAQVGDLLRKAGYPVSLAFFPGARHILLCEKKGGQAALSEKEIIRWIEEHL